MRINDKNLSAFAVSATPVDKEGYLFKKGEVNKNFQKRYFLLKGNLLFYFERKGSDKEPVGVVILEGCTIELAEDEELYCFKIVFHGTNNRSYVLGADSQEAMEQWMKALACASYDYMKLMVAELQRQLADIEGALAIKTPSPLTQAVGSPVPPPRQRHNPFNKMDSANHQRSHSMRTTGRIDESQRSAESNAKPTTMTPTTTTTMTFWELHNAYGRPILTDYNAWKHIQRKRDQEYNLISF